MTDKSEKISELVPSHILRNMADQHSNSEVRSMARELLQLRAEHEEMRRDAARYRFWRMY